MAKIVLYIAISPFLLQDVILSGAAEKGAGLEKRRLSRGGVEVFVVEVGALLQAFYSVCALTAGVIYATMSGENRRRRDLIRV